MLRKVVRWKFSTVFLKIRKKSWLREPEGLSGRCESPVEIVAAATAAKSLQSCPTLCDPIDSSPPGFPVLGILQARTLEWVAISFCNAWKWKVKVKSLSRVWLVATPRTAAYQAPPSMGFSRQEHWSGLPFPSPMQENEKWMWSRSVVSDSLRPHGLQSTRLLRPWDFIGKSTGVGCHFLLQGIFLTQGWTHISCLHWPGDSLSLCHLGSPYYK